MATKYFFYKNISYNQLLIHYLFDSLMRFSVCFLNIYLD